MGRLAALAEAALALAVARLALAVLPIRWLVPSASRPGPSGPDPGPPDPRARLVAWAIERGAVRLPWRSRCLVRALAGRWMLGRRGVTSVLCLGVAREGGVLTAHAWLLVAGRAVCGGREAPGYTPIAEIRASGSP